MIGCWVWVLLPSLFFVKILLFDPPALWPCWSHRLAVMSNSVRPTIWRQPCSIHTTATTTLWETTRPAITGIWRGGWPSAISYCILVDHGGLEWRSKTMGQQNHLFGWYGKMANWNFSLLRYQHWASRHKENYRWNHVVSIISRRNFQAKTRANDLALNFNRQ